MDDLKPAEERALSRRLVPLVGRDDVVVVSLPTGGEALASNAAAILGVPVRRLALSPLRVRGLVIGAASVIAPPSIDRRLAALLGVDSASLGVLTSRAAAVARRESVAGASADDLAGMRLVVACDRLPDPWVMRHAGRVLGGLSGATLLLRRGSADDAETASRRFGEVALLSAEIGAADDPAAADDEAFVQPAACG